MVKRRYESWTLRPYIKFVPVLGLNSEPFELFKKQDNDFKNSSTLISIGWTQVWGGV